MPTDPARVRRNDPGDPEKCPVWGFHQVYTDEATRAELSRGCKTAAIGCVDCKKHLSDGVGDFFAPLRERRQEYAADPERLREIIAAGCEKARSAARATMETIHQKMGIG